MAGRWRMVFVDCLVTFRRASLPRGILCARSHDSRDTTAPSCSHPAGCCHGCDPCDGR